jgi:CheY-like chemotaxis protein
MRVRPKHVAFIVEDDPHVAAELRALVASLGHASIHVSTLEEALAAIEVGGFCYALLDMQIPADASSMPRASCGETVLTTARKKYPERRADGKHVLQIIVVTSYSREPEFVSRMHELDADAFIAKPFDDKPEVVLEKIRTALVRAGREDHESCEAEEPAETQGAGGDSSAKAAGAVTVTIDGTMSGVRDVVLVGAVRYEVQHAKFLVFLRLVAAHLRGPDGWVTKAAAGIARNPAMPSRLRQELGASVPAGFHIVETDKLGRLRLNPNVVVKKVDWAALERHADDAVQKLAREMGSRGA